MVRYSKETIKTLLKLNCNNRLVHLEEEIFINSRSADLYVHLLYSFTRKDDRWRPTGTKWQACLYATETMNRRWLEAEPYIKAHKECWNYYSTIFDIK